MVAETNFSAQGSDLRKGLGPHSKLLIAFHLHLIAAQGHADG